ncbi:hypothetical protein BBBOND_0404080 [Babesia bigemina]|uniref:Uncharacterized protein n=1 Tax=Babesia bigemina TaxID=5866 RepID=A0A061DEV1_BABBI|nr:hypothetical protein BBBOND_0404080 [Babesia bigemina]CDR97920.1 hypothetical protein BBBOND_0404080 [Babesia bigemina]|eukprot:XP_012770106.1 hypothetical protein BBBOND_0404080 [Babesia bigemina]
MEVDRIGVPLSYAVSKLSLPPSRWTDNDEECDISDLHGDICGLYLSTSVVFCCPSSPSSVTIGSKLFQQHKVSFILKCLIHTATYTCAV